MWSVICPYGNVVYIVCEIVWVQLFKGYQIAIHCPLEDRRCVAESESHYYWDECS